MNFLQWSKDRIVVLDGAFGTMLQKSVKNMGTLPEILNLERPDAIEAIHRAYAAAGADVITANTFGANEYKAGGREQSAKLVHAAVQIARRAAGDKFVALDIGPLGRLLEPMGSLTFDAAYAAFAAMAKAGEAAGADLAVVETMADLGELKAALLAVRENTNLPVLCSMTFEANGRTFTGCAAECFALTASPLADAVGVNCSLGPRQLLPAVRAILENTDKPVLVQANAGLPDERGNYDVSAEELARLRRKKLGEAAPPAAEMKLRLCVFRWRDAGTAKSDAAYRVKIYVARHQNRRVHDGCPVLKISEVFRVPAGSSAARELYFFLPSDHLFETCAAFVPEENSADCALAVPRRQSAETGFCVNVALNALAFSGDGFLSVFKDSGAAYPAVHYAAGREERSPAAYVSGNKVRAEATITLASEGEWPFPPGKTLEIGFGDVVFGGVATTGDEPPPVAVSGPFTASVTMNRVAESPLSPSGVPAHFPNYETRWTVGAGTLVSENALYAVGAAPKCALRQETLFDIGCRNAHGIGGTARIVDAIYGEFSDRVVARKSDGKVMTYWMPDGSGVCQMGETTTSGLLASEDGNGNCQAWSGLFRDALLLQGIDANRVSVRSKFSADPAKTAVPAGILPGQGNPTTPKEFNAHWITKANEFYYDPSYGTQKISAQNPADYENAAFAGYKAPGLSSAVRANPAECDVVFAAADADTADFAMPAPSAEDMAFVRRVAEKMKREKDAIRKKPFATRFSSPIAGASPKEILLAVRNAFAFWRVPDVCAEIDGDFYVWASGFPEQGIIADGEKSKLHSWEKGVVFGEMHIVCREENGFFYVWRRGDAKTGFVVRKTDRSCCAWNVGTVIRP